MPRPATLVAALSAAALTVLGGCAGEPAEIEGRTLELRLDEYRIMPQDVQVRAGRLRIVAYNVGRLTHNVRIVRQDEEDLEAPVQELGGTNTAQPGERGVATFDRLEPGEYRLVCTISNHDDLGQYGQLVVEEPE